MNLLCSTDDNYVPYCGIMLTSLFETNREEQISVYVLTSGLSSDNEAKFSELANKYGQRIEIVLVDADTFSDCPINPDTDHVSLTAYYRLAVAELLPTYLDRILYLDCDMIVCSSLRPLYETNLDGFACGVVADEAFMLERPYNRLGIPMDMKKPYFNSGMLLINLDYWRKHKVMEQCMDYISHNASHLAFHDQDTLNGVLRGKVKYLNIRYNLQTGFILTHIYNKLTEDSKREVLEEVRIPNIIHYTGAIKPWYEFSRNPYTKKWRDNYQLSIWRNFPLTTSKFNFVGWLMNVRNELIWNLHIKPRPKIYIIS